MERRSFLGSLLGGLVGATINQKQTEAKPTPTPTLHPIIAPEDYPEPGRVFVVGESWCRMTQDCDQLVSVEAVDNWFKLRLKQLDLGIKIYSLCVRPENDYPEGTPEQKAVMDDLWEKMDEVKEAGKMNMWLPHCFKEAFREDIERWFKRRELSLSGEEAAIGVSPIRARAWMLYGWQAHWEANYNEEQITLEQQGW